MYALVIDGTIAATARLPRNLRRLDDGTQPLYWDGIDADTLAACGWFEVADTTPAYDPATEVLERGDIILPTPTTPTRDYTVRDKTVDELTAETDERNRQAAGVRVGRAVTWLRNHADQYAAAPPVTTNAQALAAINTLRTDLPVLYDGLADLLEWLRADRLGEA